MRLACRVVEESIPSPWKQIQGVVTSLRRGSIICVTLRYSARAIVPVPSPPGMGGFGNAVPDSFFHGHGEPGVCSR